MEPKGLVGGLYRISEWIMRLAVINILWLVCSIPFVFIAWSGLLAAPADISDSAVTSQVYATLIMMAVIAPFTLFPATGAMFTIARKWVMGEVDVPMFKTFFRGYKENYLQSMIGGIFYSLILGIMIIDFVVYQDQFNLFSYLYLAICLLLVVSLFNFFSMLVHYHMKTFQLLKNAILITIGRPIRSFSTAIMAAAVMYFSTQYTFLIPFFMGSVIAYLSFWNFHLIYRKLQDQMEKEKQKEAEAQENEFADLTDSERDRNH
ncbi:YesL family protein [Paenibacillus sp. YAF4_2]|jgi:uncharacterized membrane protein YesL|uniref:YesL family protein n=1 Tax=Paenibacillus sp. YAF4_2 TaxID=3233085 RepID=UPI003F9BEB8F